MSERRVELWPGMYFDKSSSSDSAGSEINVAVSVCKQELFLIK